MTWARALWLSLALMLAGLAIILLWSAPQIAADGLAPFDTRTQGYDLKEARAFLTALTPDGRAAYLGPERLGDTLFPIGLTGTMMGLTFWGLKRLWRPLAWAALLVPLAYFVADMAENAAVAGLLRTEPADLTAEAVARASAFTVWKFRLVDAALVVTALALAARALSSLAGRKG